jgi:uncharacterized repeat protein (TIGR03837 family)
MPQRWDIFCAVVDNFGDIGVCWRLARRLSAGLGQSVRLWVDDLHSFQRLRAAVDPALAVQHIDGIEVRRWDAQAADVEPADIVIEGFGVKLPEQYLAAMAARKLPPVWINLEYLSAEPWVDTHHGLPSPHPRLPLTKYFFFPGFTAATGGVLFEEGLVAARDALQADPAAQRAFRQSIGIETNRDATLWLSLFCYANQALVPLVNAWAVNAKGVDCIVPAGLALTQLEAIAGKTIAPGSPLQIGALRIHAIAFLDPDQYDRLLWCCDLNMVRGEDSFVRAQLAARPLLWQAYPQDEGAHLIKAAAFCKRYFEGLTSPVGRELFTAWNRQQGDLAGAWADLRSNLPVITAHAVTWVGRLQENGDLALNLAKFCQDRLE